IEHDLRTILLKLRQHYLRAPGSTKELAPILRKSFSGVLTLLRHLVIAFGEEPPVAAHDIVARASALTGSSMTAFGPMLKKREAVNAAWAQVDVVLQRRADLIPNLVETVKGFAAQEQTVFGDIAKARSALLGAHSPAEKIAANGQLDSALGRLLVVVENYPQ